MASAYELITRTVPSGSTTTVVFDNLPTTYKDLNIKVKAASTYAGAADSFHLTFNTSTSGYGNHTVTYFDNYPVRAYRNLNNWTDKVQVGWCPAASSPSSTLIMAQTDIYIPSYREAIGHNFQSMGASHIQSNTEYTWGMHSMACAWNGNAAITKITLTMSNGNWSSLSSVSLYGIKNS